MDTSLKGAHTSNDFQYQFMNPRSKQIDSEIQLDNFITMTPTQQDRSFYNIPKVVKLSLGRWYCHYFGTFFLLLRDSNLDDIWFCYASWYYMWMSLVLHTNKSFVKIIGFLTISWIFFENILGFKMKPNGIKECRHLNLGNEMFAYREREDNLSWKYMSLILCQFE